MRIDHDVGCIETAVRSNRKIIIRRSKEMTKRDLKLFYDSTYLSTCYRILRCLGRKKYLELASIFFLIFIKTQLKDYSAFIVCIISKNATTLVLLKTSLFQY